MTYVCVHLNKKDNSILFKHEHVNDKHKIVKNINIPCYASSINNNSRNCDYIYNKAKL